MRPGAAPIRGRRSLEILVDPRHGIDEAVAYPRRMTKEPSVIAITRAEVLLGVDAARAGPLRMLLSMMKFRQN